MTKKGQDKTDSKTRQKIDKKAEQHQYFKIKQRQHPYNSQKLYKPQRGGNE